MRAPISLKKWFHFVPGTPPYNPMIYQEKDILFLGPAMACRSKCMGLLVGHLFTEDIPV